MTSGWTISRVSVSALIDASPGLLPVPSFARAHPSYVLCTWICSFVCEVNKRLGHASCSAWCMEGRLELWAVVLRSRPDDFIGLTHRGGSEHRSPRGVCECELGTRYLRSMRCAGE